MNEKKAVNSRQNVILENREKLSISGVEHVDNFNETSITLATVKGAMIIKGNELNISKLNLEDGNVTIEGIVNSITYTNKDLSKSKGSGLLGKMFK
ncbi:sporulation protein YabP [Caldisalinibacter kiritimatiensis]|uniref:Forespore shell protein n=1 Tax=Caldisalinibacter kiritimatiensis TaxID=1304284 RepID=R1CX00_9FIRM|nr:sporulation protein YabP [Caldisalinibacter kiritimatiensis]EOD01154.1 Forespore shell protein [Caldisalinibacter kiritimatiensis]